MRFKAGTFIVAGQDAIKLNDISLKKQKELLKKYPHLEQYVENDPGPISVKKEIDADDAEIIEDFNEDDKKGIRDDIGAEPKQKRRRGRPSKRSSK